MSLLWSRYGMAHKRGVGANSLGQGINHKSYNTQYNVMTIGTFSGREDCFSIVLIPLAQMQKQ